MTALTEHSESTEAAIASLNATTAIATETTLAERLESLKAGLLGAMAAGLMFGVLVLANGWLSRRVASLAALSLGVDSSRVLIGIAIAASSGFLFSVTYRYIIRQDQNPHLKSGAVLAFGVVRALAQIEGKLEQSIALLPLVILSMESLLLFAGARWVLDRALRGGWMQPFGRSVATVDEPSGYPHSVKSLKSG